MSARAQPNAQDQLIELTDFTPGIHAGYHANNVGEAAPDGAAQEVDTWGCYASPIGGLAPMPRLVDRVKVALAAPTYTQLTPFKNVLIGDLAFVPEVYRDHKTPEPLADEVLSYTPGVLFGLIAYTYNTGTATIRQTVMVNKLYNGQRVELPWDVADTPTQRYFEYYPFGNMTVQRSGTTVPSTYLFYPANNTAGSPPNEIWRYPDTLSTDGTTESIADTESLVTFTFGHQGRLVSLSHDRDSLVGDLFSTDGRVQIADHVLWSQVLNAGVFDSLVDTVFVEEAPTGYGTWASTNASELFLVKHSGGAVAIRGSLNNPTVVRLPGVESTGGVTSVGANTPLGYIYGTRSGVWVWNGSDTAQCISLSLDGPFWIPTSVRKHARHQLSSRFTYCYPWVFAGGSWVFDIRTQGWFRLNDPGDKLFFYYVTVPDHGYNNPAASDGTYLENWNINHGRASTPDHATLDIVGDIDIRVYCASKTLTDEQILASKWGEADGDRSWQFYLNGAGGLTFGWTTTGFIASYLERVSTDTLLNVGIAANQPVWLRATLDVSNAGNHVVTFSYSKVESPGPTDWITLGAAVTTAGVTSIASTATSNLCIGGRDAAGSEFRGRIYKAGLIPDLAFGAFVALPDFTAQTKGTTSFVDSAGRTWTIQRQSSIEGSVVEYVDGGADIYAARVSETTVDNSTDTATIDMAYRFRMGTETSRWSWRSQPLARSRNRVIHIREINVVVQGAGTLAVTLTGLDGTTTTKTFTFNTPNRPLALTQPCKLSAHDVEVKLVASSTNYVAATSTEPAPRLHRMSLAIRDAQSVARGE